MANGCVDYYSRFAFVWCAIVALFIPEYTYIGYASTSCRKLGPTRDAAQCVTDCLKQVRPIKSISAYGIAPRVCPSLNCVDVYVCICFFVHMFVLIRVPVALEYR
jgi:hypothetical protein